MKIVMELPFYSTISGGVRESLKLAEKMQMIVRFQRLTEEYPQIPMSWTVGKPDNTFPDCDICITYSDTPYIDNLIRLPQVGNVYLNMLSYGMCIERESKNIITRGVKVLCSTKKLEKLIGNSVKCIGFGLDMEEMYLQPDVIRGNLLAVMYSNLEIKRTSLALQIAKELKKEGVIDDYVVFGAPSEHTNYTNATRDEIRYIFNSCKCYLMPSVSEGLNLTPIEATLCGCPSIICDGAIDEIFLNKQNCFVVPKDSITIMMGKIKEVLGNYDKYAEPFRAKMIEVTTDKTWDKVIDKLLYETTH